MANHETIIISRKGKPVAQLTPIPSGAYQDGATRFPLRGVSISIAEDFDEREDGVKDMIRMAVTGAKRNNRHCGLCGQAPSDYPEMAEFLVEIGIDSMSLTPDTVLKTTQLVLETEQRLAGK